MPGNGLRVVGAGSGKRSRAEPGWKRCAEGLPRVSLMGWKLCGDKKERGLVLPPGSVARRAKEEEEGVRQEGNINGILLRTNIQPKWE